MEDIKKKYKLLFNPGCVRKLLSMGINIHDIKADKTNPDKTVFVFKRTPEFEAAFAQINKELEELKKNTAE